MGKSRFIELMAKSLEKSASIEELAELEKFLQQFPRYKKMKQVTEALRSGLKPDAELNETEIQTKLADLWVKIEGSEESPKREPNKFGGIIYMDYWKLIASIAAVTIISLAAFFSYRNYHNLTVLSQQQPYAAIKNIDVPFGKVVQLLLPDGSQVKLNSGSHFSYPAVFSKNSREVKLEGEGFFEVTKNPDRPFLVHTTRLTVRVIGTVFNLKAYRGDRKTETTLLRGKVQIELNNDREQKIILMPNEKLSVTNDSADAKPSLPSVKEVAKVKYQLTILPDTKDGAYNENAWVKNKIVFTNDDFEDVARQMERKYNLHIVFENEALKKEQISGVLKDESIDTVIAILKQITPFESRIEGKNTYVFFTTKNK
jgi:transmembrane sensor